MALKCSKMNSNIEAVILGEKNAAEPKGEGWAERIYHR